MNKQKQLWEMTPKQYREYRIAEVMSQYDYTRKEIEEDYPLSLTNQEHCKILTTAVENNYILPNIVLDRLEPSFRQWLIKISRGRLNNYAPPEIRKINKEHEAELRKIRRRQTAWEATNV